MYSNNDFRLYHSAKGSTWKNHKYIAKKNINGDVRYIYSDGSQSNNADELNKKADEAHRQSERYDELARWGEENSHTLNYAADSERIAGKRFEEAGDMERARLLYKGAGESQAAANKAFQRSSPNRAKANTAANNEIQYRQQANAVIESNSSTPVSRFEAAINTGKEYLNKLLRR